MKEFLKSIENKIKENINIDTIKIIDNSHKHSKHKFFKKDKFHLCLEIKSQYLSSKNLLNAQREVMKVLKDDLKNRIHALEIKIIQ